MTNIKKLEWCLQLLRKWFRLIEQDIFSRTYCRSYGFYAFISIFACFISAYVYTAVYFNPVIAFKGSIMLFGLVQVSIKYIFISDLQVLLDIIEFNKGFFQEMSEPTARDYCVYVKHSNWNEFIIGLVPIFYISLGLIFPILASIDTVVKGHFFPPFGMYLPGLQMENLSHCFLLFSLNFLMFLIVIRVSIVFDCFVCILFNNMFMTSKIIANDIKHLSDLLIDNRSINTKEFKSKLIKILQTHMEYNSKMKILNEGFQGAALSQMSTAILFTTIGVFLIFLTEMIEMYFVLIVGIAQILVLCVMGTIINVSNNMICDAVTSFNWFKIPHEQKMIFLLFLAYSQQPQALYVAKIKPLNMETSILKSIYSCSAVLRSMVH